LLCLRRLDEGRDGLQADYHDAQARTSHSRTGVALDFHKRLSLTADFDEHLPEVEPATPYRNGVNPFNASVRSIAELEALEASEYDARLTHCRTHDPATGTRPTR
jgi:hypothetical protein